MRIYLNYNPTSLAENKEGYVQIRNCKTVGCCQFLHTQEKRSFFILDNSSISDDNMKKYVNILNKLDFDIEIRHEKAIVRGTNITNLDGKNGLLISVPKGPKGYVVYCFLRLAVDGGNFKKAVEEIIKKASLKRKKQTILDALLESLSDTNVAPSCFKYSDMRYIDVGKWSFPTKPLTAISFYEKLFKGGKALQNFYFLTDDRFLFGKSKDCLIFNKSRFKPTKTKRPVKMVNMVYLSNSNKIFRTVVDINNLSRKNYDFFC